MVDTPAAEELTAAGQQRLVQGLIALLGRDGVPPRHIETHISHVLLHGGVAYKLKKVLANAFLDQSTLARRRAACAEELRLNRRLAPQLYLDVVALTGTVEAPAFDAAGPVLDVAVKMRAFDEDGLWDRLAARGGLREADIDDLAAVLARFHAEAAVAAPAGWLGSPEQVRPTVLDGLRDLRAAAADDELLARLQRWEAEAFERLAPSMRRRLAEGRVREGHGDLHLGNVAREGGRCLVFDGIEFNDQFRWLDVMNEVAFMAMDLQAHGLPGLAHRFVNAYLQHAGDYDGLPLLAYYRVHRALVRAKVAQLRAAQSSGQAAGEALESRRRYLALAAQLGAPRARCLLITHGLSGSGKTSLTQGLLQTLGAVRIRADVERKRLAGLSPLQRSGSLPGRGLYDAAMNEATQARLRAAASSAIEGGWPVILDATFLRHADRQAARALADRLGVPFLVLHFDAPPEVLAERLRRRAAQGRDASEADEAVLARQLQTQEPLRADEMDAVHRVPGWPEAGPRDVDWKAVLARCAAAPA